MCDLITNKLCGHELFAVHILQDRDHDDEDDEDDGGREVDAEGRVEKYLGVKVKVQKERCMHISLCLVLQAL